MNTSLRQLEAADRAELCRRVDLLAVLRRDGVDVRRNGAAWLCRLRRAGGSMRDPRENDRVAW